jgi:hypothetical protein
VLDLTSSTTTKSSSIVDLDTASTVHYCVRYLLDPIKTVEQLHGRFGRAVALTTRATHQGRRTRAMFLLGPEHNRSVLMRTDMFRPSGLWSVEGPPGSALRAINRHDFLKTYAAEHANAGGALYPHVSQARLDGQFRELVRLLIEEIDRWPTDTQAQSMASSVLNPPLMIRAFMRTAATGYPGYFAASDQLYGDSSGLLVAIRRSLA